MAQIEALLDAADRIEDAAERRFMANVRLAVWGDPDDLDAALRSKGKGAVLQDEVDDALAAFGLRRENQGDDGRSV